MTRCDIPKEVLDEMLAPGYGPLETGYKRLPGGTEEGAKGIIKHNLEEMGSLVKFLPGLYIRENQG